MTYKNDAKKAAELNDKSMDLLEEGKVGEAIACLEEAIELNPELDLAYGNLAICYAAQKKYQEAEEAYKKAAELDPEKISYQTGLAAIYIDTKEYDEAEKHLKIAEKIDSKNQAYLLNYGLWLFVTNKYQEAINFHEEFLQSGLLPESEKRFHAIIKYRLAFSYIELNNVGKALEIVDESLNDPFIANDFQLRMVFLSLKKQAENKISG